VTNAYALGVDVGSVTIKFVLVAPGGDVCLNSYRRTRGDPLQALVGGLDEVRTALPTDARVGAVGTTGSGRYLAAAFLGADVVKNEITAHAVGVTRWCPQIRTVIEIGGQDSKIIYLENGMVTDFAMNTVCAAGTGAFLDQQAVRMHIPIEEFGPFALTAAKPVRIAGRCSVFAESDMINKQQVGCDRAAICLGLCHALVRNYLNNVARGRRLESPISFQGGVACNVAILHCFRTALPGCEIRLPPLLTGCGAYGAALMARDEVGDQPTRFRGWQAGAFTIRSHECAGCANHCEVYVLHRDGVPQARWGNRCSKGNAA
jgi:predicted CoA-substrate-specific enzyme activase